MAKTTTFVEQASLPVTSKWGWNNNTNTLEYSGPNPTSDRQDRRNRGKQQSQKGVLHFQDHGRKASDRGATPSMGSRAFGQGRQSRLPGQRSPTRHGQKHSGEHTHITMDDVKYLALDMLAEVEEVPSIFVGLFGTKQFDDFLLFLLNYFHWFFEKRTHEQKPNPMNIEPSLAEVKYYEDLCNKLDAAGKQLGRAYCVLVLGIGLDGQHHMACGVSRVSSTYKDRFMYETFYSFCSFIVWIAFRRREYEIVKKEIGRMLRSETFNPAARAKNAAAQEQEEHDSNESKEGEKSEENDKLTPAEYRRQQGKRPPIKSIINQRSPALVSILPSPKEEAHWLFKRTGALSPSSLAKTNREELRADVLQEQFQHLNIDVSKLMVGIVGEPINQFNPVTLTPLDAENEEEGEEDACTEPPSTARRESHILSTPHGKTPQPQDTRQQTAVSTVTQDALSDED